MRHTISGAPPPPPSETPGRVTYSQLRTAASCDPTAFRAFWKINGAFGRTNLHMLRWFCRYLIKEYARHLGHADLRRERIDAAGE